ncbi:hypothetical protein vseg_010802 [Gypsophila vaccaria]
MASEENQRRNLKRCRETSIDRGFTSSSDSNSTTKFFADQSSENVMDYGGDKILTEVTNGLRGGGLPLGL